ncbi:calcyphosin-2 isoform X1 [Geospiza fortis]|uniref:Calcyphosin-2 isoform X1 n=1 Tax=Geospiza fortis TaxID=48883 RepID=A0A8N5HWF9_GEOFO|nr:calcyphosin-2 isoform X2 [Camarhynchus parvulus]XP_030911439.1 calcyphosin-2 isoform X1 [Geospiza fortis]
MDLEVKGVGASPRRKAELSLRGKKCQGWRPNRQATNSPCPPEVPCLDLGRLGDSDEEDGDSYMPYTGSSSLRCQQDSSSEWRMSLQTPYAQHQHRTRPENLPSLRDRSKSKHGQYEAGMKEEYKQHPQRIAEKKKDHLQCPDTSIKGTQLEDGDNDFLTLDKKALLQQCYTNKPYNMQHNIRKSEAEDVASERRKQAVVEQVMVDQLCRAVISDPEQSTRSDACKEAPGLLGVGMAPMRFRKRTLHETKIRTKSGLTENMLSNKLRFDSRIISRNGHDACRELIGFFFMCDKSLTVYEFRQFGKNRTNALPFIQKGVYHHQRGQRKGKAYDLSDFYVGANLTFRSVDHNLPESVKQNPFFTLRVISIDEAAMDYLKASSVELKEECSRQVVDDSEVFKKIQGIFRETLSKRGFRVITGLGKYFRQMDKNRNGLLSRAALKEALKVFHLEMPEGDFESLWLILDDSKNDKVDYGEFTHAIFGEMNEYRKTFVRKAYMKLDFNKTGSVPMVDVRKCYCAKKHPLVLAGKTAEEEIKSSFLEALGESCSNPNEVSYSEFEDYYEGLSFGIVGDDDFVNILRNSWGI